ncbi:MAG: DUF502 domain-containing protein [Gammaproteobacteria bacterium]
MVDDPTIKRPHKSLIRRYLITGLLAWVPLGVTIFVIQFFAGYLGGLVNLLPVTWQPKHLIGFDIPGLSAVIGIIIVLAVLFVTGFIASNFFGRYLLSLGDDLLEHIPLVRSIYSTAKQISDTMFSNKGKAFRKVVMIRYPQKDTWSLAFLTSDSLGELEAKAPRRLISVFIPTTPNPTSGFLIMVPPEDMIELEMSVDEAFKMIVSLGVIVPPFPRPPSGKTLPGIAREKRDP